MEQILVLLNPTAGTRRAAPQLCAILDLFCKAGFAPIVRTTQERGDGVAIAAQYAGKVERIVCIGGDGTFNEVVSGVLQSGNPTPIGYIPAGSTNDFAASLGLPHDLLQAAQTAIDGTPRAFDVGRFGERYFTYVASFGAFTQVSYATDQNVKNVLGHLAYVLGGVASLPAIHALSAAVSTDAGERIEGEWLFGAVGNSTSLGGVLTLDKQLVDMQDGLFELLLVKNPANAAELGECVRALLAQDYSSPMLVLRQLSRLSVEADPAMDWTLDGEFAKGSETVEIEVMSKAVQIITQL